MKQSRLSSLIPSLLFATALCMPSSEGALFKQSTYKSILTFAVVCVSVLSGQQNDLLGEGALAELSGGPSLNQEIATSAQMASIHWVQIDTALGGALGSAPFSTTVVTTMAPNTTVANTTASNTTVANTTLAPTMMPTHGPTKGDDKKEWYEHEAFWAPFGSALGVIVIVWGECFLCKLGCYESCLERCCKNSKKRCDQACCTKASNTVFGRCWDDVWCKALGFSLCCPKTTENWKCSNAWNCLTCGCMTATFVFLCKDRPDPCGCKGACCGSCANPGKVCRQFFCCETCYEDAIALKVSDTNAGKELQLSKADSLNPKKLNDINSTAI